MPKSGSKRLAISRNAAVAMTAIAVVIIIGGASYVTLNSTSHSITAPTGGETHPIPSTSTSYYSTTGSATTSWCQAVGRVNFSISSGNVSLGGPAAYDSHVKKLYITGSTFIAGDQAQSNLVYVLDPLKNMSAPVAVVTGSIPTDVVFDPINNLLYVANYGGNTIAVINDSTNSVVDNISVGMGPVRVAFDPFNQEIYVSNRFSGTVSIINATTDKVASTVNASSSPFELVYDALNHDMYVTDGTQSTVTIINSSSNAVAGRFSVDSGSGQLVYDPANTHLYFFPQDAQVLYVINSTDNKVIDNISGIYDLNAIGYDPANQNIYVAGNASGFLYVISGSNYSTISLITGYGWTPVDFVTVDNTIYLTSNGDNHVYALTSSGTGATCKNPSYTQLGSGCCVTTTVAQMTASGNDSSETNITATTSVTRIESYETPSPCTPSPYYMSTTTQTEQSTTTVVQVAYDGTDCSFGNALFEPPSAILIPAGTFIWTNFQLHENGSYSVSASISFLSLSEVLGANVNVAVYVDGVLNASSLTSIEVLGNAITNSSLMPSSNSSLNSIFALKGMTPTGGVGTQSGPVNLNGSTITIAFVSDKPLWLCGWTPLDMSKGTGAQFGESPGQLNGTYEWSDPGLAIPGALPQPTATSTFELQISGGYHD